MPQPMSSPSSGGRDQMLDGFRAIAVAGVIAGHSIAYRFLGQIPDSNFFTHRLILEAGAIAETGVHIFFVISGYIITTLMLREERREGSFSLAAFYIRRSLRILPPFAAFLITVFALARFNLIELNPREAVHAILFTCNTGFTECSWFVAHSWSLAVEEQYYLVWPLLFTLMAPSLRGRFAMAMTLGLTAVFLISSLVFNANSISFACIAAGATCALLPRLREALERAGGLWTWPLAVFFVLFGALFVGTKVAHAAMPFLAAFLVFGGRNIGWLRALLESRPLQFIGGMSYSLYLWQQLFLAAPERYVGMAPPSVWLLPVIAWISLVAIERPAIRLAHRWSAAVLARNARASAAA